MNDSRQSTLIHKMNWLMQKLCDFSTKKSNNSSGKLKFQGSKILFIGIENSISPHLCLVGQREMFLSCVDAKQQ